MTHAHEFYRLAWITTHHNKSKYSNKLLNSYETIMQNLTIVDIEKVFSHLLCHYLLKQYELLAHSTIFHRHNNEKNSVLLKRAPDWKIRMCRRAISCNKTNHWQNKRTADVFLLTLKSNKMWFFLVLFMHSKLYHEQKAHHKNWHLNVTTHTNIMWRSVETLTHRRQ